MPPRHAIEDSDWERIKHLLPGQPGQHGKVAKNNRLFIDAILWIAKTGAPWRDLPEDFGNWNSLWRRFDRWAKKGVWQRVFEALQDPDLEWVIVDSTAIRAHPHAAGAQKKRTAAGAKPIRPWGGAEAGSRPRSMAPSAGSAFPPSSS
jgi:transposase